jgi:hypothetical protein
MTKITLQALRDLVRDDAYASSYQSLAHYRGALLRHFDNLTAGLNNEPAAPEPVDHDLLPPLGSKVLIHLARQDAWVEHTVTGYYVWPALKHQVMEGEKNAHRVFIRVKDAQGYNNARLLSEFKPASNRAAQIDGDKGEEK